MKRRALVHAKLQIAQALADETRLRLLLSLLEKDATVTALSEELRIDQPRVSSHLAILKNVGLVSMAQQGRQRVYSAVAERADPLAASLAAAAAALPSDPNSVISPRGKRASASLREARTCYDHLAGVAGVALLDAMLLRGFVMPNPHAEKPEYVLTTLGETMLFARGVRIDSARRSRRRFACSCQDWTEGRPHLGGALGKELLVALVNDGVVARRKDSRAVVVEGSIEDWLDETFKASIQAWSDGASDDQSMHLPMEEMT